MTGELAYLASPYSHLDPSVREARFDAVCRCAGALLSAGVMVYSPIAHTHPIATRADLPLGWEFWHTFDLTMISRCSRLLVLQLDGWQESTGVRAEIELAEQLGLEVVYLEAEPAAGGSTK